MGKGRPLSFKLRIREAINDYSDKHRDKLTPQATALLERLADSFDFAEAFDRLKLEGFNESVPILHACIIAEQLHRTFTARVSAEKQLIANVADLRKAVGMLKKFVSRHASKGFVSRAVMEDDGLTLRWCRSGDFRAMSLGLELVASLIEGRHYAAITMNHWLGTTRNAKQKTARGNVAISQIAQAVRRVTGSAHTREIAEIAGLIVGVAITEDRVRAVVRKRMSSSKPVRSSKKI